jgi:hypothetical protein
MTNHYTIVDGPNGEPTVASKQIEVRGHYSDRIIEIIKSEGWEAAAQKVCSYCGGYIPDKSEGVDNPRYVCGCSDPIPSEPGAPV